MTRDVVIAAAVLIFGARAAHAEETRGGDMATADALFAEGKRLSATGDFLEACAKFEASMGLVPRLGVQLNLADCYEHIGKTASAWVAFGEAAALARRNDDPREAFARQRQDAVVPRLSRLRILVAHTGIEGFSLTRDGVRVAPSVYGVEVPVDPGGHRIEATAPAHVSWSTRVVVSGEGEVITVEVPKLESTPLPASAVLVAQVPAVHEAGDRRSRLIWFSAGVGVSAIGAGTVFGIAARSLWQDARRDCDPLNNCTDAAHAQIQRSRRDGDLATVAFAIGGAALATSLVLYLWNGRARPRSALRLVPSVTAGAASAAIGGAF